MMLNTSSSVDSPSVEGFEALPASSFTVGYLGPEYSHSHQALHTLWTQLLHPFFAFSATSSSEATYRFEEVVFHPTAMAGIAELVQGVKHGKLHLALIPYENSLEGSVRESIEEVFFHQSTQGTTRHGGLVQGHEVTSFHPTLMPVLEFSTLIQHCLAVHPTTPEPSEADGVNWTVWSHPMAFRQSRHTLKRYFGTLPAFHQMPSTSAAACALSQGFSDASVQASQAVVCSKLAIEAYGLKCLQEHVNDEPYNETRFLLLASPALFHSQASESLRTVLQRVYQALPLYLESREPSSLEKVDLSEGMTWKLPLCIRLKNRVGVLADCLQIFSVMGLDLSRIESVPLRRGLGEYRFHIDVAFKTQPTSSECAKLIEALQDFCVEVQWLEPFVCLGQW
ncbi:MAG: prephenate dehydratase [Vampirovibrionales bacterium]